MSTRGVDVFNVVRQVSSDRFQEIVPSAAESNILELKNILFNEAYKPQLNEFVTNLINRIGLTIVRNKSYNNPLAMFKKGAVPLGTDIQDIYTNPAQAEQYVLDDTAAAQLLRISTPDTKAAYYRRNRQDKYVKTIARQTLQAAFDSWDKFEDFIVSISQSLYSGAYIDEFKLTKDLIEGAYANGKIITEVISDPTASEANAKAMIKKVRALYTKMQAPSSKYNAYSVMGNADTPVVTWTDSSRVVFITTADVMASVDVDVLAAAFNMSHADFIGRVVVVDGFDDADIYGILCDEAWLQIYDNLMQFDEFYNASVMAWNEYLHVWGTFAICPFANAVCLAKEKPVPATAISVAAQSVAKGSSKTVTATLTPSNSTTGLSKAYSGDERIATVELDGGSIKLKGVAAGSTTGYVVAENGLTAQFTITVTA